MEQLESLLTCPICLDRYRNPKLLPCQHSFCMEPCMEGLVDYVRRQVKCPECRAEARIPYQGVQAFPTNVTLQRFLELHIEMTGEIPDPTSNQIMERCQVCSEKSYCVVCAHCDKKVCPECKDAHMDVLKREISRISNQVRRVLHRLEDALSLTEKNSLHLQQNSLSVVEEIDDVYRRLAKALKDRAEFLKHEVERYLQTELRNLSSFKHNMDQELSNIQSNCDLVDKYMQAECTLVTWDDCELMGTKDIFLKTMEFIRNFEYEPGDYARRVKFLVEKDPNTLAVSLSTYGDLYLPTTNLQACILGGNNAGSNSGGGSSSSGLHAPKGVGADAGSGLMRSKSDHRLTMQYRGQEYEDAGAGVAGRTSPVFGRKFGERKERAGGRKELAAAYDPSLDPDLAMLEVPTKSRFRSRFARHLQDSFEDSDTGGRGDGPGGRKERERVLDTEDVTRGPLSGITKLIDSPRVIQRLQETETAGTKVNVSKPAPGAESKSTPVATAPVQTPVAPWRAPSRQVSEDDEIAKQKKMNKEGAAAVNARAAAATPNAPRRQQSNEPKSPPVTAPTRTSTERSNQLLDSSAGAGAMEDTVSSRQRTSQPRKLSPERVIPKNTRSESSDSGRSETSSGSSRNTNTGAVFSAEEVKQRYLSKSSDKEQSSGRTTPQSRKDSTTPNPTATGQPNTNTGGSNTNTGNKDQQSSAGAAAAAAGGAANGSASASSKKFQSRFLGKPSTTVEATKESSTSSSSESEDDEDEESESESSDDGTVKKTGAGATGSSSSGNKPTPEKTSRMEKTDIGPLLAKSANARDTSRENALGGYNSSRSRGSSDLGTSSTTPSIAAYRRSRDAVSRVTSPPEREVVPSRYNSTAASASNISTPSNNTGGGNYGSSRYSGSSGGAGTTGTGSDYGSGLTRSRTGSALAYTSPLDSVGVDTGASGRSSSGAGSDASSRYNKYLNRSRHTFDDDLVGSSAFSSPSSAGRYGDDDLEHAGSPAGGAGASSRVTAVKDREKRREKLAKSKSSASIGHAVSFDDGAYVIGERRGSITRRPSIGSASGVSVAVGGGAGSAAGRRKSTSTTGEIIPSNDDSASLSSWARYLKNKYGKGQSKSLDRRMSVDSAIAGLGGSPSLGSPRSSISGAAGANLYLSKKKLLFKFGSRGSDPGYFTWPRDVSVGPDGQIVVTDSSNHRIQVFNEHGAFISEFGSYGSADGELDCPAGVCVNRIGQFIISDRYNHRIVVLDPSGRFLRAFGSQGTTDGRFNYPWGVTTDCLGFIFVCDKENNRICVFQSDGTFVGKILGLNHPHYIAVTSTNRVIVSDTNNHRIVIFDVNGHMITSFGSEGSDDGQFKFPRGIAVDETYGYVIVGDSGNNRIQIFTPDYKFLHSIGTWGCGDAEFKGMEGLAVTGSGKILVVDREQHCVKCF